MCSLHSCKFNICKILGKGRPIDYAGFRIQSMVVVLVTLHYLSTIGMIVLSVANCPSTRSPTLLTLELFEHETHFACCRFCSTRRSLAIYPLPRNVTALRSLLCTLSLTYRDILKPITSSHQAILMLGSSCSYMRHPTAFPARFKCAEVTS